MSALRDSGKVHDTRGDNLCAGAGCRYGWLDILLVSGAAALAYSGARASTPTCALAAEQEEGPYFIEDERLRRDITEGRPGVPLQLRVALVNAKTCAPLENAALDIWHCDALGVYSGFTSANPNGGFGGPRGPGGPGRRHIDATRFLRGVQITGASGIAEFATLYPGWYSGRAIHIHLKVHMGSGAEGHVAHTGQFFFPEEITQDVAKLEPYATRLSVHRTTQEEDGLFRGQHGASSLLNLMRLEKGTNASGFLATITVAVDPEATPAPVRGFGPRGGRPPGPDLFNRI